MHGKRIEVTSADGHPFGAYLSTPASGTGPGLVICQEIFGVNAFIREVVDRYAAHGFTVLAPDLFWRLEPGVELGYENGDRARAFDLMGRFDTDLGVQDIKACVQALRAMPGSNGKVGVVGFCLGGRLAYLAAARSGADCAVGYYGVSIDKYLGESSRITEPLMLHFAREDHLVPPETVERIARTFAGCSHVSIHVYPGVDHAFARTGGANYHEDSATTANARTLELLRRTLAAPVTASR